MGTVVELSGKEANLLRALRAVEKQTEALQPVPSLSNHSE